MGDFVIRESDGWIELDDVESSISRGELHAEELWTLVGQGRWEDATELLASSGFENQLFWPHWYGELPEHVVQVVQMPDDIRGAHTRVWVRPIVPELED